MAKRRAPDLMTRSDAAKALGVSREWIRRLEEAGKLRALYTAGGKSLFLTRDIERFQAKRQKRNAESEER